jgi:hypothetical protein
MIALSGKCEDIPREGDIDLTRVDSCHRCYYDDLLSEIEYIDGYLPDIDFMVASLIQIYLRRFV